MPKNHGLKRSGPGALVSVPVSLRSVGWEKLLVTWLDLMKSVEDPAEEDKELNDVGWWYGERTLTGLLAAAAWKHHPKLGWWAIEEFASERTGRRRRSSRSGKLLRKSGRGDLWLGLECPDDVRQHCLTIEAKQTSSEQQRVAGAVAQIQKNLELARKQLRKVHKGFRHGRPAAICYCWPAFAMAKERPPVPTYFREIAREFIRGDTVVAIRWCDYDRAPKVDKWVYPGVIMVGRVFRGWSGWSRTGIV